MPCICEAYGTLCVNVTENSSLRQPSSFFRRSPVSYIIIRESSSSIPFIYNRHPHPQCPHSLDERVNNTSQPSKCPDHPPTPPASRPPAPTPPAAHPPPNKPPPSPPPNPHNKARKSPSAPRPPKMKPHNKKSPVSAPPLPQPNAPKSPPRTA